MDQVDHGRDRADYCPRRTWWGCCGVERCAGFRSYGGRFFPGRQGAAQGSLFKCDHRCEAPIDFRVPPDDWCSLWQAVGLTLTEHYGQERCPLTRLPSFPIACDGGEMVDPYAFDVTLRGDGGDFGERRQGPVRRRDATSARRRLTAYGCRAAGSILALKQTDLAFPWSVELR